MNTVWIRHGVVIALMLAFSLPSHGQEDQDAKPIVRIRVEPRSGAYVGQAVRVYIEVLVTTWFSGAPKYPELRIPDAVSIMLEGFAQNFIDRTGGTQYTGQRREYLVYPQRAGVFTIPAVTIEVPYAIPGVSPSPVAMLETREVRFEASVPEEAAGLGYVFATPGYRVEESFDPDLDDLKVGDSFRRTIRMSADDTLGMLLPPIDFETSEGLHIYPDAPQVAYKAERGTYLGTRTESVTYMLEAEGDYHLPEVTIHWWDTSRNSLRTEILPERDFTVSSNPGLDPERLAGFVEEESAGSEVSRETGWRSLLLQVAAALAGILAIVMLWFPVRRILQRIGQTISAYQERRAQSEETYFKRLRRAAQSGDAPRTMRYLMSWLDRANEEPAAATLSNFVDQTGSKNLQSETGRLTTTLYSATEEDRRSWTGRDLAKALDQARHLGRGSANDGQQAGELSPLNPAR